jgi:multiple sugar transport system substrate-binding protein
MFISILSILILISSCNKKEKSEKKIVLTYMYPGDATEIKIVEKYITEFEKVNPDIKIKKINVPTLDGYFRKLLSMFAGGTPPDVFYIESFFFRKLVYSDLLLDLEDYFKRDAKIDAYLNDIFPRLLDLWRENGRLYALPRSWTPVVLFYNKDIFDEAGIRVSNDWDWNTLTEVAKKLTIRDKEGRIIRYGLGFTWGYFAPMYIWQNGGKFFNDDYSKCLLNSQEVIDTIQWYSDLINKYKVMTPPFTEAGTISDQSVQQLFMSGRVAMYYDIFYMISVYRTNKNFRFEVMHPPKNKKRASVLLHSGWGIYKNTKYPEAAFRLVKFFVSPVTQKIITQSGHDIPVLKSLAYSKEFLNPNELPENENVFLEAIEYSDESPFNKFVNGVEMERDVFFKESMLVFLQKKTAKEAVEEMVRKINILIEEEKRLRKKK